MTSTMSAIDPMLVAMGVLAEVGSRFLSILRIPGFKK